MPSDELLLNIEYQLDRLTNTPLSTIKLYCDKKNITIIKKLICFNEINHRKTKDAEKTIGIYLNYAQTYYGMRKSTILLIIEKENYLEKLLKKVIKKCKI